MFHGTFIRAADRFGVRAGAIQLSEAVDATEPAYLATFRVVASLRATGRFAIDLTGDASNFLDTLNGPTHLRTDEPVVISVEEPTTREVAQSNRSVRSAPRH